jgi:hypothetical protein
MDKALAGFFAGVCLGGAAGYYLSNHGEPGLSETPLPTASTPSATNGAETQVAPGSGRERAEREDRTDRGDRPVPSDAAPAPADTTSTTPPPSLALPGGTRDVQDGGDAAPIDKLLDSMSVYCTFDAGAGGYWPQGKVLAHTAAWQGGPLEFDAINLVDHTALMTRHPWPSAAPEGTPLGVTATDSGLHFSGFKPDGELIVATVYGALDSEARYRAVVSLHGPRLNHESAQFYGWCTVR